jgi:tetratricopeptide (TPR) repeat protein
MSLKSYIILFLSLALNANICISQNTDRQILEQGFTYEREGKYKKAIDTFARLHLDEQRLSVQTSVWNSLYKCNMAVGRYPMSNVYLRKLLSVVSNESSRDALWINLSDNQWSLGDYKSMLSSLDSVTNQGLTVTRRINALVAEGKYDQAIDRLDAYLSTSTNEEEKTIAIQNMGYVEWARGHLKIASDLINKALQRIPKSAENYPVVLSTYGYIL